MRDPTERLRDILEAIAAIEGHLSDGREAFERDELLQAWFVRHLQIIGEAARGVPDDVRALAPEIEWSRIIGMRNVLVHGCSRLRRSSCGRPRVATPRSVDPAPAAAQNVRALDRRVSRGAGFRPTAATPASAHSSTARPPPRHSPPRA